MNTCFLNFYLIPIEFKENRVPFLTLLPSLFFFTLNVSVYNKIIKKRLKTSDFGDRYNLDRLTAC
jgi:hypothetical protein